jgi:transposase-like protein
MSKQKRARRVHTREFKADTVKLVREGGRSVGQVEYSNAETISAVALARMLGPQLGMPRALLKT